MKEKEWETKDERQKTSNIKDKRERMGEKDEEYKR